MDRGYESKYNKIEKGLDPNSAFRSATNLTYFYNGVRRGANLLDGVSPKLAYIVDLCMKMPGKKVIFSNFISTGIDLLRKALEETYRCDTISGSISKENRNSIVVKYNADELDILFISKAGSEGLDLKETAAVILMEPGWNETQATQTIGRAVRYQSHVDPNAVVHIYKLYLIKESEMAHLEKIVKFALLRNVTGAILSIDLYLRNYSMRKQIKIDTMLKQLQAESIEADPKCMN